MKLPLTQKGQMGIICSGFTYIIGRFFSHSLVSHSKYNNTSIIDEI